MNRHKNSKWMQRGLVVLGIVGIVSCVGGGFKNYYVLTPDRSLPAKAGVGIGVGPVSVAEYADRSNLVVAETPNRMSVSENHRWAGDLPTTMSRVLATNLGGRLNTNQVQVYPWKGDEGVRYQVSLDIRQFHAGTDGYAVMEGTWKVYTLPGRQLKMTKSFMDREPMMADGYTAMVEAQSRMMGRLADAIATGIR